MVDQPQQQQMQSATGAKRLIWLVVFGVLCVALARLYLYFSFGLSIGSGPAGPAVNVSPFKAEWTKRSVLLVGLGDSVTAGFGARRGYGYYVHLVNFHDTFLGHGLHCGEFWSRHYDSRDPHYWYYANLEDPNERGYDAIRRLFLNEIAKVAKEFR